jgi:lipopolysaccharide/colanic/teichoic acid biosynthesis glycosyltransferase
MSSVSKSSEFTAQQPAAYRSGALTRVFDFLCSLLGLLSCSPFLGLIALAVKLDDGGPVFYSQDRVGRNFRLFRLHKFRTMTRGADRHGLLTASADSRLTRLGRVLRRYKLDELPQLVNVLKGDMQLVGARPEVERFVQMFRPHYAILLEDRPGITDPASLAYRHEDRILSADRLEQQYISEVLPAKLALSLDYQQRRTFLSDLTILLRTAFRVLE